MSRPPAPSPIHPPNSTQTTTQMAMTETQNLPHFPPPPYLGDPYRRLPQPVQLPPLAVPRDPVRPDFPPFFSPSQRSLPSIHSLPTTASAPAQSRPEQHRSQSRSAAPVDKLLSSNPYTPPRSDPPYSPSLQYGRNVSPRSQGEPRGPPPRPVAARYPEEPRPIHQESHYAPQGNPHLPRRGSKRTSRYPHLITHPATRPAMPHSAAQSTHIVDRQPRPTEQLQLTPSRPRDHRLLRLHHHRQQQRQRQQLVLGPA